MPTLPVDLCSPSYLDYTLGSTQKRVNMYSVFTGKKWRLVSYPGLQLLSTVPNNLPCRGAYFAPSQHGAMYTVNGNTVYLLNIDGTVAATVSGTLLTSTGLVEICSSKTYLLIVDGSYGYYIQIENGSGILPTQTLVKITDDNFPAVGVRTCAFMNGRFIVSSSFSDTFYESRLEDPATWTPSLFASAESKGDAIHGIVAGGGRLYVLGGVTIEQFYPAGGSNPFESVNGSTIDVGADNQYNWAYFKGALFFCSPGATGAGAVWKITNGLLERISTPDLEILLSSNSFFGFCYTLEGQDFYEITSYQPGMTFCYNITSKSWFELQSNVSSSYRDHRVRTILNVWNNLQRKPVAFDSINGNIYNVTRAYNSENGTDLKRVIDFTIDETLDRTFHSRLRLSLEIKHDTAGSYTLSVILNWSDDGGLSYNTGETLTKDIVSGTTAQKITLISSTLGMAETDRRYRLTLTGPAAAIVLRSADLALEKGGF